MECGVAAPFRLTPSDALSCVPVATRVFEKEIFLFGVAAVGLCVFADWLQIDDIRVRRRTKAHVHTYIHTHLHEHRHVHVHEHIQIPCTQNST